MDLKLKSIQEKTTPNYIILNTNKINLEYINECKFYFTNQIYGFELFLKISY